MFLRRFLRTALVAGLAASTAGVACSGKKNTELVIAIQTDLRIPKDLDAVTLEIADQNGNQFVRQSFLVGPNGLHLPATIGIVAKSPSDVIDVTVTGQFGDLYPEDKINNGHVIRRARYSFAEGRTGLVRLPLRFSCYDVKCNDNEACVAGVCKVVSTIEGATLPEFSAAQVYGPGANGEGNGGKCWDPSTCLNANVQLAKSRDDAATGECFFPLAGSGSSTGPDGGGGSLDASADFDAGAGADAGFKFKALDTSKPLNVFMVVKGNHGFCDSSKTCRVPLDFDAEEGWHYDDTKTNVVLPVGLCAKIAAGAYLEASDACETKLPSLPLCDLDSSATVGSGPMVGSDAGTDGGDLDASIDGGDFDAAPIDAGSGADGSTSTDSGIADCGLSPVSMPPTADPLRAGYRFLAGMTTAEMTGGSPLAFAGVVMSASSGATCPSAGVNFDGTQYATATVAALDHSVSFSVSTWVRASGVLPANGTIVSTAQTATGLELGTDATRTLTGTAWISGTQYTVKATGATLTDGWHSVVLQWAGAGKPLQIFIDGVMKGQTAVAGTAFTAGTNISIGRRSFAPTGAYWTGMLGDIRFYGK